MREKGGSKKGGEKFNVSVFLLSFRELEQSMNFMTLSADSLDKLSPQEDAFWRWGRDFWCHGNILELLPTRPLCPIISETFLGIKWKRK